MSNYYMGVWELEYTDEFETWWDDLDIAQQNALTSVINLLIDHGPNLKRPIVGEIKTSRHTNMKELRTSKGGALRVLFAFDPLRHAILLCGGNKTGLWNDWYKTAINQADDLYDTHLQTVKEEEDHG